MPEDLTLNQKRFTQLNEKVSETQYDILYPETHAEVVHTTEERQFVSEAEKELWNAGLRFVGSWAINKTYNQNEVVAYNGKYYIMVSAEPTRGVTPLENVEVTLSDQVAVWRNINYEAYLADRASAVSVTNQNNTNTYNVLFVNTSQDGYKPIYENGNELQFKIEDKTVDGETTKVGTLVVDRVEGTVTHAENADHATNADNAKEAEHALEADHAKEADHADEADYADESGKADVADKYIEYIYDPNTGANTGAHTGTTPVISDAIHSLEEKFESLEDGELNIKVQPLNVQFDGKPHLVFDGSAERTLNIKQTYGPGDLVDFLDGKNKIKEKWLPSSLVGAMSFIGIFDANEGKILTDLRDQAVDENGNLVVDGNGNPVLRDFRPGDYFIITVAGNFNPSGGTENPEVDAPGEENDLPFYRIGDWAVYVDKDGSSTAYQNEWIKIDNTDSVKTVNNQIGDVQTYKGTYAENKQYYGGDIVLCGVSLYLATTDFVSSTSSEDITAGKLIIFGKVYQGTEPIIVDNTLDKISHKETTVSDVEYEEVTLNSADATIDVTLLGYDKWGHINSTGVQKYKLGDFFQDSTRPIKVKDTEILKGTEDERKFPINYKADGTWLDVEATGAHSDTATITFKHKTVSTSNVTVKPNPATDTTLYFGSTFKIPTITFDKAGHYSSAGSVSFTLSDEAIKHKHFDVKKEGNALTIQAHEYSDSLEPGRFYTASGPKMNEDTVDPNYLLGFKGSIEAYQFIQKGNEVLDESIEISSGYDYYGEINPEYDPNDPSKGPAVFEKEIIGTYDKSTNKITLGDSGIFAGDEPRTYSAVAFNKQGIAVAGGYVLQFGGDTAATNVPSTSLVVGGLFFRRRSSLVSASTTPTPSLEEALA